MILNGMISVVSEFSGHNINQKICNYADEMKEPNWIKLPLVPFSWLYGLIAGIRNWLYDQELFASHRPDQFTISVGNITVGGTGKTPMVEYITEKIKSQYSIAILSRGYGRKTNGLLFADNQSTAKDIGDEPLQYFRKYGKSVIVAVCEDRVKGARAIHQQNPECSVLLLDDAFQHRRIKRDINILLSDYNRPFYHDLPLPAGRLREFRSGAERADLIITTKCPPGLRESEKSEIRKQISRYSRQHVPVFFASIRYAPPVGFDHNPVALKKVKVVAGIARPQPFLTFVKEQYEVMEEIIYPDHHNYTREHFEHLIKNLKSDTFVLTTEKDMVKLEPLARQYQKMASFAFIPIGVDLGSDTDAFDDWMNKMDMLR